MKKINGIPALLNELKVQIQSETPQHMQIVGGSDSLLHLLLQVFTQMEVFSKNILLVLPHQKDIFAWQETLESLFQRIKSETEIFILPHYLVWGPEKYANHIQIRQERLHTLYHQLKKTIKTKIILTSLNALAQFTLTAKDFLEACIELRVNTDLNLDEFIENLHKLGYQASIRVEEKGYYSLRGGILDIFPIQESDPVRIEMIEDSIHSIRHFSSETQRSSESIEKLIIAPFHEVLIDKAEFPIKAQALYNFLIEENVEPIETKALMASFDNNERIPVLDALTFSLLDTKQASVEFFGKEYLVIFPQTFEKCLSAFREFRENIQNLYTKDRELKHAVTNPSQVFLEEAKLLGLLNSLSKIEFANPILKKEAEVIHWQAIGNLKVPKSILEKKSAKEWLKFLKKLLEEGNVPLIVCESADTLQSAKFFFEQEHRDFLISEFQSFGEFFSGELNENTIYLVLGFIPESMKDEENSIWLIPYRDIFGGRARKQVPSNRKLKNMLSSFRDLSVDDLVVHIDHGIGRYKGMTQLELQGNRSDFLLIEYRQGDKIYLPVDRLNLLQKYKKEEGGKIPLLDKLGSDAFVQRKARVLKSVENIAEELIKVHAERKILRGHAFSEPGEIYERFIEDFPYQETADQVRCLEDLEEDFKGAHPMDRLIIGDVGFGKTEIALRAALRSILEGFQVMFLVPTTVLCYQHYYNFTFRLEKYGVKIGQVHRLVKASKQKEILRAFESGQLDFLIGTHRILSKDVKPKNLGLLIVDEEQRFGVMQKEKFKKFRANIDILTLSATPIPRTLHMALLGLRDISLITTPPLNRMPVRTILSQYEERLVKGAIESEILRGGQVFYIHNRVENLAEIARSLSKLVPLAKVRTAHGQMHEQGLDAIIIDFLEQKFNVLVCTTIVESGVDMPNVNTLIVENSENFGLAQLHQLRGRVGRSSIQAYAYLLTKKIEALSDEAMKRLEFLVSHQELGSGFQLANYDLDLRGAGNLIGKQQSGQIAGVGLELYVDMLDEKIKELSLIKTDKKADPEIRVKVTAIIPVSYISDEKERLDVYKRFFSASAAEEIFELEQSSEDRYGQAPQEFKTLAKIAFLRLKLRSLACDSLVELSRNLYEIRVSGPENKRIQIHLDGLALSDSDEIRMGKLLAKMESLSGIGKTQHK